MLSLKKSFLRAAVFSRRSGQITVWLSLSFLVFLSLYLVCFNSVQKQNQRRKAEHSVEAGMFSLFSEFEPHLLDDYSLLYVDTSFRSGRESTDEICSHLWHFIENNAAAPSGSVSQGLHLQGVNVKNPVRATDGQGAVFYRQAIRVMKARTGISLAEDWDFQEKFREEAEEDTRCFLKDCETYEGSVENYESEDEEEALGSKVRQWDGLRNSFTLSAVLSDPSKLSERTINPEVIPSRRNLSQGMGCKDGSEDRIVQKQWFISYLCKYFKHAREMMGNEREGGYLDYQMEYIIGGHSSDRQNLEQVIQKLLLIRQGINYVFLISHPEFSGEAEALADILAGFTGSPALVKGLKHLILLGWACGESLVEVRQLLRGYELSAVKGTKDWQVSLSGLLELIVNPGKYDEQTKKQQGLKYEFFLRLLLSMKSAKVLAMRSLDIIEGELQLKKGCEKIHLDHCVESLTAQVWMEGIYLERTYGYD